MIFSVSKMYKRVAAPALVALALVSLSILTHTSCASSSKKATASYPGAPVLLGQFKGTYLKSTGELTIEPATNYDFRESKIPNPSFDISSAAVGNNWLTMENCAPADWNPATRVFSINARVYNQSMFTASPGVNIQAPLYFITRGFVNATTGLPEAGLLEEINTDYPSNTCSSPNSINGDCDLDGDDFLDPMWPDDTGTTIDDTQDDPANDLSGAIGGDYLLSYDNGLGDGERSSCIFIQYQLSREEDVILYWDIWGVLEGSGLDAPVVNPSPATPTSDASPNITVELTGGADAVRVTGGSGEVICVNGDACDQDASATTVTVDYSIKTNQTNNIFVYQRITTPLQESSATVLNIVHDNTDPVISSISPPNTSIEVSPATNILVTFDGNLLASSVNTNTVVLYRDGGVGDCSTLGAGVNGAISQPSASQALFNPTANLNQTEVYCVVVVGNDGTCGGNNEIQDEAGNCLASTSTTRFTTANSDSTPPLISSVVPVDGANGVAPNTPVQILFNEAMDSSSIVGTSNITVEDGSPLAGTLSLSADGKTATFTPSADYTTGNTLTVRVTTDVTDLAGNNLATEFTSTFIVGADDSEAPTIVEFLPADQATNVNENVSPQITFSEPMNPTTINTSTIHIEKKSDSTPIPATVSLSPDGLTATLNPLSALEVPLVTYLVSVEFGCTDLAGNNLATPQTAEFTTQNSADTDPPGVTQITPANNSSDVSTYTAVVVVFDEPIDPNTVHTGTFYLENIDGTPVIEPSSVAVAIDGLSATLTQNNPPLTKNEDHRVTITTGVTDVAGNPLSAAVTSEFTTEFQDNTSPYVEFRSPGDTGAAAPFVATDANVVLVYSEPVAESTVNTATIELTAPPSTTPIAGTVSLLSDGISVRFNPTNNLSANTLYQIDTSSNVKDLSNRNALASTAQFTTGADVDVDGPVYVTSTPDDGDTDIDRWPNIEVYFDEPIDPNTVTLSNIELVRLVDSSKVALQLSITDDALGIIFNPTNLLESFEDYRVNVKTGLRNLSGYALQSFTSFDFKTIDTSGDMVAPHIDSVLPVDGATGVATNTSITIVLSEEIDPDTAVLGVFTVQQSGGNPPPPKGDLTLDLAGDRRTVTITPLTDFKNNTTYDIRVTNEVVDDANNPLDCAASDDGACDTSPTTTWIASFRT